MLSFSDVLFPKSAHPGRMLDDKGELTDMACMASSGEIGYALIARAIVEYGYRLDQSVRERLKDMLDRA
jgi:hypothetical protein